MRRIIAQFAPLALSGQLLLRKPDVIDALAALNTRINLLEKRYGREPGSVALLAISKGQPIHAIAQAQAAGQSAFGESYVREALDKMEALRDRPIEWHFIGRIQGNKTRPIAEHFAWVHSIDRIRVAKRLARHRPTKLGPLQCCIEVRLENDPNKGGVSEAELDDLASQIEELPGLTLRGLMTVASTRDPEKAKGVFSRLAKYFSELRSRHPRMDTLSMGMSADLEQAIAAGSTMIRVGSLIFGPRRQALN